MDNNFIYLFIYFLFLLPLIPGHFVLTLESGNQCIPVSIATKENGVGAAATGRYSINFGVGYSIAMVLKI